MREEDLKRSYRPDVAKDMEMVYEFMLKFYRLNHQAFYYKAVSEMYDKTGDKAFFNEAVALFSELSDRFTRIPDYAYDFYEKHRSEFEKYGEWELVSDARAFYLVGKLFEDEFDKLQKRLLRSDFTKQEFFDVNQFCTKLFSPLRNPNIRILDGYTKCSYDEPENRGWFQKDLASGIQYVEENCPYYIELYNEKDDLER